jgi:hypothetical protein
VTTDPGEVVARERVAVLLERLAHVELGVVVVAAPDAMRRGARERARDAALSAGRGDLLDEAAEAARTTAFRMFSSSAFSGTWAATEMAASVASAADRVAAANAFEEAAMAAAAEDLVDDETLETLRATTDGLMRSSTIPAPGSLSSLASPVAEMAGRPHGALLTALVVMAGVIGVIVFGSIAGAVAVGGLVAAVAWLISRPGRRDA